MEWKRRKSRSTWGEELYKYYYYREGQPPRRECNAVAFNWQWNEKKGGDDGDNGGENGGCGNYYRWEMKKERLEEPISSNGKMGREKKSNRPDDEPAE